MNQGLAGRCLVQFYKKIVVVYANTSN